MVIPSLLIRYIILILVFVLLLFIILIPLVRLGWGYVKDIFYSEERAVRRLKYHPSTYRGLIKFEKSEKHLKNYLYKKLPRDCITTNTGMPLNLKTSSVFSKNLVQKIFCWDQTIFYYEFESK